MEDDVEADHIQGSEYGGLGSSHGLTCYRVDFIDGVPILDHRSQSHRHPVRTDTVGDKVGGVFTEDDAFSEDIFPKSRHGLNDVRVGAFDGNDFQKPHVPRGIEKMGPQEALFERGWHVFGHGGHGNPRGVGADYGVRREVGLQFLEEVSFDGQILDDGLNNPVCFSGPFQVVFKVPGGDQFLVFPSVESSRLGFDGFVYS